MEINIQLSNNWVSEFLEFVNMSINNIEQHNIQTKVNTFYE